LPADISTAITPEPGTKLVIVDFPNPPPPLDNQSFGFTLNFQLPGDATPVHLKALFAARAGRSMVTDLDLSEARDKVLMGVERRSLVLSELDRVKQEYTQAARQILQRSMKGVAKTKLTPDMLTMTGVSLCLAGALLVGFEQRNEKAFFWIGGILFVVGSVADILDGALARAASKGTVFGAFLDSTFDRLGEAAILAAIGLTFMHDGNEIALLATFAAVIGSFLVSYTRAKAEALGLRGDVGFGSRVERVVLISIGLGLAPWGWLQWPVYLLAAMTWLTVVQRILFVRRQLRELAETGT
jgi:CDP-diacylglycerol--glycerol-3-phosphate 3-phosphatidyltransferase